MKKLSLEKIISLTVMLFLLSGAVLAQSTPDTLLFSAETVKKIIHFDDDWQVVFTDDEVTDPGEVDFSKAVMLASDSLYQTDRKDNKYTAWCRKFTRIDSNITGEPLSIRVYQSGSLHFFINDSAQFYFGYNEAGDFFYTNSVVFNSPGIYKITARFYDPKYEMYADAGLPAGFFMYVSQPGVIYSNDKDYIVFNMSFQMFFTAFVLSFALLHLILFIYMPELKANLYFLLFLIFYAANIYFDFQSFMAEHISENLNMLRIQRGVLPLTTIFLLKFLYSLFYKQTPRYYFVIVIMLLVSGMFAVYYPITNLKFVHIAVLVSGMEIFRILYKANKLDIGGAKIVTAGFVFLLLFSLYDVLNDMNLVGSMGQLTNAYMFGAAGLIICISIYLANQFALTNRQLAEQEVQKIRLEEDNKRKTWELEEARKLQLSLLPQCGDELLGYEVCFEMRTATEVGGDYYDYMITNGDTLTVVIGDATGHGMKAGNMVVLIKSLFNTMGHTFYIPDFFNHCTRQIKRMNFGNLFMSMSMIKLRGDNGVLSTAGMPPALLYRKETGQVEELLIKGMPLGAHDQFPYQEKNETMNTGDVLLMMSDGIIELFNESKKMFGIERVKEILKSGHTLRPSQITALLFEACENWQGNRLQDDDITLIVLKRK